MKKAKLSVVVIARNEEKMIGECLKSVSWADEVLVVDQESTDETRKVAEKYGAKVIVHKWSGKPEFSKAREMGRAKSRGEWILYLDADERVGRALRDEIEALVSDQEKIKTHDYYAIPRENVVFGKILKRGGWWPDYVKRLFRKESLDGWRGELHEEPVIKGEPGHLKNPLRHIKHETLAEMVEKTNNWSEIEGKLMFEAGHPRMNAARFGSAVAREFWYRMIRKGAFLDGPEGIIMALYQVYSRFISYAKLWERQEMK